MFCKLIGWMEENFSRVAKIFQRYGVSANMVTSAGLAFAGLGLNFAALGATKLALLCFLINRLADVLDGAVARLGGIRPFGIFYDLFADYASYGLFLWGFILLNPQTNASAGAFLFLTLLLSGISLLGYALASNKPLPFLNFDTKSCLLGAAHNLDMFLAVLCFCLLPEFFTMTAIFFGGLLTLKSLLVLSNAYYVLEISKKGKEK